MSDLNSKLFKKAPPLYGHAQFKCPACPRNIFARAIRTHISKCAGWESIKKRLGEIEKTPHLNFWNKHTVAVVTERRVWVNEKRRMTPPPPKMSDEMGYLNRVHECGCGAYLCPVCRKKSNDRTAMSDDLKKCSCGAYITGDLCCDVAACREMDKLNTPPPATPDAGALVEEFRKKFGHLGWMIPEDQLEAACEWWAKGLTRHGDAVRREVWEAALRDVATLQEFYRRQSYTDDTVIADRAYSKVDALDEAKAGIRQAARRDGVALPTNETPDGN